jgi:hypothetical protein
MPETPAGTVGGQSALQPYGAAYEHARRLTAHADRVAALLKCRTHWAVQSGEQIWRGLVHVANWDVKAADDSPQAEQYRAHAAACLGIGATSPVGCVWRDRVGETLTAALLGFGLWETWAEQVGGVWYTRAESRHQGSILRWVVDRAGRLLAAEQQVPGAFYGGHAVIPMSGALLATYGAQAADDFSGVGLLRAVEPLYRDSTSLSAQYAAGAQRWATPTPDVTIDDEIAARCGIQVTPEWISSELAKWAAVARDYTVHERAYIARPPWVKMGVYGADVTGLAEMQAAIDAADRRILSVFYGQWLMLGTSGSGGSYSLGETQVQAARDHAQALCDWIARVWQDFIVRAVEWEFGPVDPALIPRLQADGLGSDAFVDHISSLYGMSLGGLIVPDAALRARIRAALDMPPEDPGTAARTSPVPGQVVLPAAMRAGGTP